MENRKSIEGLEEENKILRRKLKRQKRHLRQMDKAIKWRNSLIEDYEDYVGDRSEE